MMRKYMSITQILILIVSIISIAYLISETQIVSAENGDDFPTHCCAETLDGQFCQSVSSNFENCKPSLLKQGACSSDCLKCCPQTNSGQLCQTTSKFHNTCSMALQQGVCASDCLKCCSVKKYPEEEDERDPFRDPSNFCIDTSKYHDICADRLYNGRCVTVGCNYIQGNLQEDKESGLEARISQIQTEISRLGDITLNCCPETVFGAVCMDIPSTNPEYCETDPLPTSCELTSNCQRGCCFDKEEGLCTPNTIKQDCTGKWEDNEQCSESAIPECRLGCCELGAGVQFVTEQRCELLSSQEGLDTIWSQASQLECLAQAASQKQGACVYEASETCRFKTESECISSGGIPLEGELCSKYEEYGCTKQESIGCLEGKDEIYWFDSCGNRENIYSSNKESSWNNGNILSKEESCNQDSANINSASCGNCNRFLSSICSGSEVQKVNDGDFTCKSLKCEDENRKTRNNGESWCNYDSAIGDGKDTVGSRHWLRRCVEGEIKIEPCADYRGQVCTESEIIDIDSNKVFSTAACVTNEASECVTYNRDSDMAEKCSKNKHCTIKNINVADHFKFDLCVPEYPRGFIPEDPMNKEICSIGSQTCTVVYVKDWKGDWNCEVNCACESAAFAQQMNDLCISLGDCGSYINYKGHGTNNIQVSGAPNLDWNQYTSYKNPNPSQKVPPQNLDTSLERLKVYGESMTPETPGVSDIAQSINKLGTIAGGLGGAIFAIGSLTATTTPFIINNLVVGSITTSITGTSVTTAPGVAGTLTGGGASALGAFAGAAVGAALGSMAANYLIQEFGITGNAATVMMFAGAIGGAAVGYGTVTTGTLGGGLLGSGTTFLTTFTVLGWTVVIAAAVMVYIVLIGWGETEERHIRFECLPWEAPSGGADCSKCNEDPLKPCSNYRCESLGQACKLLNENTENPSCEAITPESNPPVITPGEILDEGYRFQNSETKKVEIRKLNDECIQEWTPIIFTLETNEFAQCKYDFSNVDTYDELSMFPLEGTVYGINHTLGINMPGIDSLEVYNITGDIREWYADTNLYVRCQDYHGNFNLDPYVVNFCVNSGPDTTPARINTYSPRNGGYLKYRTTDFPAAVYLNEPAECKYDVSPSKPYDEMANTMQCETSLTKPGAYGWACNTTLPLINGENKFYIKCKDKPWVQTQTEIDEYLERNTNTEDFIYTLIVTDTELLIDSTYPSGDLESGFEPTTIDLEVKTSGGAEAGKSTCHYEWAGNWIQFFPDTFSSYHKQSGLNLLGGSYEIRIKCEDIAGNIAYSNATFKIEIDNSPPIITRAFKDGGSLRLITDEEAKCYYDFSRCSFNTANASSMTTALSKFHSANWQAGKTYHIKCADIWENKNSGCAIIVRPSEIG
ncbi:MAG: hypothetical protein ABIB79_05260 [archaeon]